MSPFRYFFLFPVLTRASDTSGVLVMAKGRFVITLDHASVHVFLCACAQFFTSKGRDAASEWAQAFARGLIKKMYLAVVSPAPADADGVIVSEVYKGIPSSSSSSSSSRERMISRPSSSRRRKDDDSDDDRAALGAKSAVTEWKLLHRGSGGALLLLQPVTGRTHQLRVHCADVLKCPVVGDRKYGPPPAQMGNDEDGVGGGRLQLHAAALVVPESLVTPQLLKLCRPVTAKDARAPAANAVVRLGDGRCGRVLPEYATRVMSHALQGPHMRIHAPAHAAGSAGDILARFACNVCCCCACRIHLTPTPYCNRPCGRRATRSMSTPWSLP